MRRPQQLALLTLAALGLGIASLHAVPQTVHAQEANQPAANPNATKGTIDKVTLYRGEALVSRSVTAPRGTGAIEVVVSDLPANVMGESLYADGSDDIQVRAVRYRERFVGGNADTKPELLERLEELEGLIRLNTSALELRQAQMRFLGNIESFTHKATADDLNRGQLNAETLVTMTNFVLDKRSVLHEVSTRLTTEGIGLDREYKRVKREFEASGQTRPTLVREAVVFLDKKNAGEGSLRLNYLVGNVSWTPTYTIRATSEGEKVKLEYNALVQQLSGEDWGNAELTLSTATPSLISQGGDLVPFQVRLDGGRPAGRPEMAAGEYARSAEELKKRANAATRNVRDQKDRGSHHYDDSANSQIELTSVLNSIAQELQTIELNASADALRRVGPASAGISVEYRIAGRTNLMNRGERQLVTVLHKELETEMSYVATPILNDYIFLEANLRNDSKDVLLSGESTSYLDGRFVGRSTLPMVSRGERFTVGFGIDDQLRVSRELVEKKEDVRGGNLVTTYTYRMTLQNFKDRNVNIRLFDRMPTPQLSNDIKVRLIEEGSPLSKDVDYLATERPLNILRWDLEVKANAFNATAHTLTYKYEMEHDKNLRVVGG